MVKSSKFEKGYNGMMKIKFNFINTAMTENFLLVSFIPFFDHLLTLVDTIFAFSRMGSKVPYQCVGFKQLILEALLEAPEKMLPLKELYAVLEKKEPSLCERKSDWKVSIILNILMTGKHIATNKSIITYLRENRVPFAIS